MHRFDFNETSTLTLKIHSNINLWYDWIKRKEAKQKKKDTKRSKCLMNLKSWIVCLLLFKSISYLNLSLNMRPDFFPSLFFISIHIYSYINLFCFFHSLSLLISLSRQSLCVMWSYKRGKRVKSWKLRVFFFHFSNAVQSKKLCVNQSKAKLEVVSFHTRSSELLTDYNWMKHSSIF